jgi:uncharacterized protein with von Willebrand factor type A (vWA) domain
MSTVPIQDVIVTFLDVVRSAGVRVSVSETLDAVAAVEVTGYRDRAELRDALSLTVAKSAEEKEIFESCFDGFFNRGGFNFETLAEPVSDTDDLNGNLSRLSQLLLAGDQANLAFEMEMAAIKARTNTITTPHQINVFAHNLLEHMGIAEVQADIGALRGAGGTAGLLAAELQNALLELRERAYGQVRHSFEVYASDELERRRDEVLAMMALNWIPHTEKARLRVIIRRMARRLVTRHAQVMRTQRKGQLDVRKIIRLNAPHDGVLFRTAFRHKKIDRPKIVAICDVSGSMAASAEFMLLFLWSLRDVLAGVRAFAFSNDLEEVTSMLEGKDSEKATEEVIRSVGMGVTNYEQSLETFKSQFFDTIDRKTTVIMLADARGRGGNPRSDIVREISQRSKRLIWLNPEPEYSWGTDDSMMYHYKNLCHVVRSVNTAQGLEVVISDLLEAERAGS